MSLIEARFVCVCGCGCDCVHAKASMSPGYTSGTHGEPLAVRKAPSIRCATVFPLPWHWYTCRPFLSKTPISIFKHQSCLWESNSHRGWAFHVICGAWAWPVGADLKRWTHLAGVWGEHPHTQIHTQQHTCYLFVDFTERLQYHRKNNTANVIVCLFAYFVQSVCQMQIESTRQLQHAPPPPSLPHTPPHGRHSPPGAVRTHPAE